MLHERIRSMQRRTWVDELPDGKRTDAEKAIVLLVAGGTALSVVVVLVTMCELTSVNVAVIVAIGLVAIFALVYGGHDLREARIVHKQNQAHKARAVEANLCVTTEVCLLHLKRRPKHAEEVFGADFVNRMPSMTL